MGNLKFAVRRWNGTLGYDLGPVDNDLAHSRFYNGLPHTVCSIAMTDAEIAGVVELTPEQFAQIMHEYEHGGECLFCNEIARKLKPAPDSVPADEERMCQECWNVERTRRVQFGQADIGPFDEHDPNLECLVCHEFVPPEKQSKDEHGVVCEDCIEAATNLQRVVGEHERTATAIV